MSHGDPHLEGTATSRQSTTGLWGAVAVLLALGIVVPLLVPVYDAAKPTLFGFPFFYWFQFLLIPIVSGLTFAAFRLSQRATPRDRARHGLPADPQGGEQ